MFKIWKLTLIRCQFGPSCISILSSSLTVAIPSSVQDFLDILFKKAVQSPSCETIRTIYRVLSGLGLFYLDDLGNDILMSFQTCLSGLLARLDLNDPFGNLLCLATFARFAKKPHGGSLMKPASLPTASLTSKVVTETPERLSPARRYFNAEKAQKTLNLAVLKVINACSRNNNLSPTEALETLTLSEEIVDVVSPDEKQSWTCNNQSKMRNLYEKILRPDIDESLECTALSFVIAISAGREMPLELRIKFERVFTSQSLNDLSPRTLKMCTELLSPNVISEEFLKLVQLAWDPLNSKRDGLVQIDTALRRAKAMTALIPELQQVRAAILEILGKKENAALFVQLATPGELQPDLLQTHHGMEVCPFSYVRIRSELQQRLIVLIVNVALDPSSEPSIGALLTSFLGIQINNPSIPLECMQYPPCNRPLGNSNFSFFEAGSTPQPQTASHNWREHLRQELSRDIGRQQQSVTRMVGEVCRDLEVRCNEAERPLREEEDRSRELRTKLEESQTRASELEAQTQSRSTELTEINTERSQLLVQLDATEHGIQNLSQRLEQIEQELRQCKHDRERDGQATIERSRQQDLHYMPILTAKDLMLEEQATTVARSESRIAELEVEIGEQRSQALQKAGTITKNNVVINNLNNDLDSAKDLAATRQVNIDNMTAALVQLTAREEANAIKAMEESKYHGEVMAELGVRLEAEQTKSVELQQEHERYVMDKDAQCENVEALHRSSEERAQAKLEEALEQAAKFREESLSHVSKLKKEIKRLHEDMGERAKEVAEAKALKCRFMAFMRNMKSPTAYGESRCLESATATRIGNTEDSLLDTGPTAWLTSSASSKCEPTLKSIKRHRVSPQTPTPKASKGNTNFGSVRRSTLRPQRTSLADIGDGPNSDHLSPTQRIEWFKATENQSTFSEVPKQDHEALNWNFDEESFDGANLFTSTNQQHLFASRSSMAQQHSNSFDETTTDL